MANDASQIVIGSNGAVSLGAVGDAVASDPTAALTGFTELGYLTSDGISFSDTPEILNVESWQSNKPTRKKTQTRVTTASFTLQEWHEEAFVAAFGGGNWASEGGGVYRYDPPDTEDDLPERCVVLDWQDGDKNYRLPLYKAVNEGGVETTINRQGEAVLPITFEVLEPDDGLPWNLYTDDPAFAPVGS